MRRVLGIALICLISAGADAAVDRTKRATVLFDDNSLDGWVAEGVKEFQRDGRAVPVWSVRDGLLHCEGSGFGFLRYDRETFGDFTYHVEYKLAPGANSGVGVRTTVFDPAKSRATRPSFYSYEIQLFDDAGKPPTTLSTGSLYRYVAPQTNPGKPAGEWNKLHVTCVGTHITVKLNDKVIVDVDQSSVEAIKSKPLRGYVCLQNHGGNVDFRNIYVSDLSHQKSGLAIIAPDRFLPKLVGYAAYRSTQRTTELQSLETILKAEQGADHPEKLKRWLHRAWAERNIRYVLLVGDANIVPVRYMTLDRATTPAFNYAFYPSDLYYADIAGRDGRFDDWNSRKDGFHASYFGEVRGEFNKSDPINYDAIDYRPELAVGRWPVDTPEEVADLTAKTLTYERGVLAGTARGLRKAAFVAVPGWVDTRARMDEWAGHLPAGWSPTKLYNADSNERSVVDALNSGASLVVHAGHGHDLGWERSFSASSIERLKNADRLPVVLSAGCSTARFATLPPYEPYEDIHGQSHAGTDHGEVFTGPPPPPSPYARDAFNRTGLGERLLRDGRNGAVAYIGCNTGSQPCGLTLVEGFTRALADNHEPTLGDCWVDAVDHYYAAEHLSTIKPTPDWYPASIFFQAMKFMVFGDPSMRLPGRGS